MTRYDRDFGPRGLNMGPHWGNRDDPDPNWRGGHYHGMRMDPSGRYQAAYGRYRQDHARDLGGYGGFDGRHDSGPGRWDREGLYHDPFDEERHHHRYGAYGPRRPVSRPYDRPYREDGGVRGDNRYLRQYNAHSPELRRGYDRGYGYAEGPDAPPMRGVDARGGRTREREYGGYNTGGFSDGKYPDPGIRS